MAVVTKYTPAHPLAFSATIGGRPRPVNAGSPIRQLFGEQTIANGDSIASVIYFGQVPSSARILPASILYHEAITGVSDFDIGLKYGDTVDADVLADGVTIASAGTKSVMTSVSAANRGKYVWQLLGLASDPGGLVDVIGTLNAAASAAGLVQMYLQYQVNN